MFIRGTGKQVDCFPGLSPLGFTQVNVLPLARIGLLLAWACSFSWAANPANSFTKDQTVIIIAGLPGDMESERTFTDETGRLLVLLNNASLLPKKVVLLSNLSALPDFKPNYPLEKLPNDRATFLGLAEKIKTDAAASPVYFLFGHGGTQGSTPVFHVPGPRILPTDLVGLANASPASTWLLFFPGSKAFATEVQGPQRTVLATEADQIFTGDPISFGLLLDLMKNDSDLNVLGPKLGAATDHWYTSRSLARTEEPALWVNGQPPRKLVGTSVATNPGTSGTTSSGGPVSADGAWKAIQPVEAREFPQSDAVILSRRVSLLVDDSEQLTEEEDTFLQILTKEGKRFGGFDFSFSPDEDLTISACEVRRPDGQIEQLDPDNIHETTGKAPEGYSVPSQKIFQLPHAEPGSILHVRMQRTQKHFPLPHMFEEVALNADIPIVALKVDISVPEKSAFHFKFIHHASSDPVIARTNYGSTYSWQWQNIPAAAQEALGAGGDEPRLAVSTFPDWAAFADWYRRLIRESDTMTPELEAQARELVKDAKTDQDKIAAVTQFVTNFRYVSIPLGVNSYRPHAAANVLKNRYGDCKDKANLLNTLLKSLGYKTSLVLVPRFTQAYEDLPGFAFNHAISQVQLNGKTLWIDSTDDVCRIGLLPPGDPGRKVLVINDSTNALTELPKAVAHDHRIVIEMTARIPEVSSRVAEVKISAQTVGYGDYLLRAVAKSWSEGSKIAPLLTGAFHPASGQFETKEQEATAISDLDKDFSWKADGTWNGLVSHLPQSPVRMLRLPCWLPKEWPSALLPRASELQLNEGYPMEISESCAFHLPAGVREVKLPTAQNEDNAVMSWKLSWSQASATEITAKLELSLLKAELDPVSTKIFQASCSHLQDALQDGLSFQIP